MGLTGARARSAGGYSAIELLMTVGLIGIVSAIALFQVGQARPSANGDGAMRVVLSQINGARELAITQRRYMRLVFGTSSVQIIREDTPVTTTVLSTIPLEGGVQFMLTTGVPDTPDAFGNSTATYFGTAANVKFTPDGTLVNQDGVLQNGTAFLAVPNANRSARAISILGSTGRVRGYKWNGKAWTVA